MSDKATQISPSIAEFVGIEEIHHTPRCICVTVKKDAKLSTIDILKAVVNLAAEKAGNNERV
jgi:hypothetical protein